MSGYTPIPKLRVLNMGTEGRGTRVGLYDEQGKMVGYTDKDYFANGASSVTYQDDSLTVKFNKNYQKFYLEEPFYSEAIFDEEAQTIITTKLEIDINDAQLGSSTQLYVTGEMPFSEYDEVHFQNPEIYKETLVNLIVLDYKSQTNITAVVINSAPIEINILLEPVIHVAQPDFTGVIKFDKKYEIGSYTERVNSFSISNLDAIAGAEVKVFYNAAELPTEDIKWTNQSAFVSNSNCLITLYKTSTGEIIGNIYTI